MKIIKVLNIDVPKGKEVASTNEQGTMIVFTDLSVMKLPKGNWKMLSVNSDSISFLPKSKEFAIADGWIV